MYLLDTNHASRLSSLLALLSMREITAGVAEEYGRLKAALIAKFGPRNRRQRASTVLRNIGVSDNDLWIASVALHFGLTLVSGDSDFARIKEVAALSIECWVGAVPSPTNGPS